MLQETTAASRDLCGAMMTDICSGDGDGDGDPPPPPHHSLRFNTWVGHVATIKPLWEKSPESPGPRVQDRFLLCSKNKRLLFLST